MMISATPLQKLPFHKAGRRSFLQSIPKAQYILLTENGRSALFQGLNLLKQAEPGRIEILLPAYHCGTEVEAVVRCGFTPAFYHVAPDCQPDLNDLESKVNEGTAAVIITHLNGFPQPIEQIKSLCQSYSVCCFEDCAHVLRTVTKSGQLAGGQGDMAIFSPHKLLPLRYGGVLAVNNGLPVDKIKLERRLSLEIRDLFWIHRAFLMKKFPRAVRIMCSEAACFPKGICLDGQVEVHDFAEAQYGRAITRLSHFVLERLNVDCVVAARIRNYAYLEKHLKEINGVRSLCGELPRGTCPWLYLAELEQPKALGGYLRARGIEAYVFWSYFHKNFPRTRYPQESRMKTQVIALPIHQDLSIEQLAFVVREVKEFFLRN